MSYGASSLQLLVLLSVIIVMIDSTESQSRIIGGNETDISKYGYLASIRYRSLNTMPYMHKCAGFIYSRTMVVTCAQCVHQIESNNRTVIVAGANSRTGVDGMMHPITKWFAHPNYDTWVMDSDIGVIYVEVPFDFEYSLVRSIGIRMNRPIVGKLGNIAGWGYREEFGPSSKTLEETQVPIVSDEDCIKAYSKEELTSNMICAGYLNGGKDACQGDSGGPLVIDGEVVGLVSWGRGCARPGYPSVYTYVINFKQWIDDTNTAKTP